jgi:hypothetical protein
MVDKIVKIACLICLLGANTFLIGVSYKLDVIIDKLNKIEFIQDVKLYKG